MDLDQISRAGPLVEGVDVLGHQSEPTTASGKPLLELHEVQVGGVGFGLANRLETLQVPLPLADRVALKVVEGRQGDVARFPDGAWFRSPEGGNSTGLADSGSGDDEQNPVTDRHEGSGQIFGKLMHDHEANVRFLNMKKDNRLRTGPGRITYPEQRCWRAWVSITGKAEGD